MTRILLAVLFAACAWSAIADAAPPHRASKHRESRGRASLHTHVLVPAPQTAPAVSEPYEPSASPITTRDHGYGGFTAFALVVPPVGASLQGGGASFRIHGAPALALDLSIARLGGTDILDRRRTETPIALTALLYPSPGGALQPYFPVGVFYDFSAARDHERTQRFRHVGGMLGFGLEVFLSRDFAVFGDARLMLRGRVGGDAGPEFAQGAHETNVSTGMLIVLGAAWYPFGKY